MRSAEMFYLTRLPELYRRYSSVQPVLELDIHQIAVDISVLLAPPYMIQDDFQAIS